MVGITRSKVIIYLFIYILMYVHDYIYIWLYIYIHICMIIHIYICNHLLLWYTLVSAFITMVQRCLDTPSKRLKDAEGIIHAALLVYGYNHICTNPVEPQPHIKVYHGFSMAKNCAAHRRTFPWLPTSAVDARPQGPNRSLGNRCPSPATPHSSSKVSLFCPIISIQQL